MSLSKRTLSWLQNRVKLLIEKNKKCPIQRSDDWFKARYTVVTASEAASCLPMTEDVCKIYVDTYKPKNFKYNPNKYTSSYDTRDEYIIKKCNGYYGENVFKDSIYTLHGKKFEDIASRLYRQQFKTDIIDFGLLPHSRLKYLSASPDGITPDGVMIEIKCPYSRKIQEGSIPIYYYIQIQIQLECTDLEQCDFLECEIKEITLSEFNDNDNVNDKGILLNKVDEPDNSETKYIYPPDDLYTTEDYINWSNKVIQENTDIVKIEPIYYIVEKWYVLKINREKEWFNSVKHYFKDTIEIIKKFQQDKQLFENFKESIYLMKNKKTIDKYNNTVCLIHENEDETTDEFVIQSHQMEMEIEIDTEMEISTCIISDTEST